MLQNLRDRAAGEEGFTLIELLVVVLIIGILAAIALPTFLGQKDKAKDSSAKSDVRNAISQMESCLTGDSYSACSTPPLNADVIANGTAIGGGGTENAYTLSKTSTGSGTPNVFSINKTGASTFTRTCTTPGNGGCPSTGATNW